MFTPERVAMPVIDFAAVAEAVASGAAEFGVLPVRNSRAGEVPGVAALLADARLEVVEERALAVRVHLLALPGVALDEVVMIASHPVALAQCAEHVAELGIATEEASNTAVAAGALDRRDRAALASEAAALAYGLTVLKRDMHDDPDNATTFALIRKAPLTAKPGQ